MKWVFVKLETCCQEITVGHVGSMAERYVETGILFLRSQNITPFRLNLESNSIKYIPEDFHLKLKKSSLRQGDVVVVRTGYPGTSCVIPNNLGEINCADLVIIRTDSNLDSNYLCYFLNSPLGKGSITGGLVGAAQQHFNVGVAKNLKIPLPPLPIQQRIASILSAYDDLIENNLRRIRLLEEAAQLLYREWFVQLRFPGHEKKNGILKEWKIGRLAEIVVINSKSIKRNQEPEEIQYIDITSVGTGVINSAIKIKFKEAPGRARRILSHGDIIWATVRPNRKSFALIINPENNLIASTGFAVLSPKKDYPFSYI